jgi:hypothetical protein
MMRCWGKQGARPTFDDVVTELRTSLLELRRRAAAETPSAGRGRHDSLEASRALLLDAQAEAQEARSAKAREGGSAPAGYRPLRREPAASFAASETSAGDSASSQDPARALFGRSDPVERRNAGDEYVRLRRFDSGDTADSGSEPLLSVLANPPARRAPENNRKP